MNAAYRHLATAGSILCFHDVTPVASPAPGGAHVTLDAFMAIVDAIGDVARFVPLSELLDRHERGRSTAGLVAVTFDDAYTGLRLLSDVIAGGNLPISIFAVSDGGDSGPVFWWDRVDAAYPRVSPGRWREFEDACGLPDEYRSGQPQEFGPLRPLRQWILARHAGRWPLALEQTLAALEHEVGSTVAQRGMTFSELAALMTRGPVEVGVHTRTHPVLPLLEDVEMRREISDCHDTLRAYLPGAIPVLAAPYGLYDERTLLAARDTGMRSVLTLGGATMRRAGVLSGGLPRFCVMQGASSWRLQLAVASVQERVHAWRGRVAPAYPDLPSPSS